MTGAKGRKDESANEPAPAPSSSRTLALPLPPGPPAWRALHNLRGLRRDPLAFFSRLHAEHGDVAAARLGPRRICLLAHPELTREVLVTRNRSFVKTPALRRARQLLGEGLLTSEGEHHLRQRRLAQPAFHRERIAGYGRTMVEYADRTARAWREGEVDMHREMMRLTLEIASDTLFGAQVRGEAERVGEALEIAIRIFQRSTLPFVALLDRLPLPSNRRFWRAREGLDALIFRIIRERRASGEDTGDLLSMLLLAQEADERMTDEQVRDEVVTLFLAGHETTANALSWTWQLLARHPEVEARLHAELDAVLGGRLPAPEDVPSLPFTRAVLAESMRLFPPAWIVGREAVEDCEVGGYRVPAGTLVFMSQWVIHRDARFFPDPERFQPDRWTPEREAALPRFAYFPFGGGPRKCIGEGFAWMEGVLVLATLASRWRALALEPARPQPLITLRPRGGMRMELRVRKDERTRVRE